MKTKTMLLFLGSLLLVSLVACLIIYLQPGRNTAIISVNGVDCYTVSLTENRSFTVESEYGTNTIFITGGKISVTDASCPDHTCIKRGAVNSGMPVICMPNRLVIRFTDTAETDAVIG